VNHSVASAARSLRFCQSRLYGCQNGSQRPHVARIAWWLEQRSSSRGAVRNVVGLGNAIVGVAEPPTELAVPEVSGSHMDPSSPLAIT
jgi:hypothetical protein